MEEGEQKTVSLRTRKELRKQKLLEYLAGKGKLKQPNPKAYLGDVKKPVTSTLKVVGKENKIPAAGLKIILTQPSQSTKHTAAREAFSVTNKVNVKASVLTGRHSTNHPPTTSRPAQSKIKPNLVLTRTYPVVSSKSHPNAARHLTKQPNTGQPSSIKVSSNTARSAVTKSSGRFNSSSNATWSCPVSDRISLGPLVTTKTGLIPAVNHPRNRQSQNFATVAERSSTTASVANKVHSNALSSLYVSQSKTLPTTVLNNPDRARAGIKVKNQSMCNSKPLLVKHSQPSCKTQSSHGLKSMSTTSKCTTAPIKPQGRVEAAGRRTDTGTSTKQKNSQPCKLASGTSSGPVSRCSSVTVAVLGGKTKTCKEKDAKKGNRSSHAHLPQMGMTRTRDPVLPQTVPRPSRTINHTGQAANTRMPKVPVKVVPQTEGKKVTAAQEERMKKLQEWREAKGISYKRPPMPVKLQVRHTVAVPQPFWDTMNQEDEAHSLICAVDRSLADCIKLLEEGCPPGQVKEVLSRLPAVSKKFAKYWICQARLMEQEGNLDVLPMFEEAVGVVLEPVDELRVVVFEILKKKDELPASAENGNEDDQTSSGGVTPDSIAEPVTPKPVRALICGEKGDSSVVKYKITSTPGGLASRQKDPARVNGQEVRFFTPVRRSVRIERSSLRYPMSLQDHDLCVASYNDLISEEDERREEQKGGETSPPATNTPMYVYRQNEALQDKVFVQLVYDEDI